MESIIIGIAGGSGSGKSTFTNRLKKHFGDDVVVIYHDNYYRRQDGIPFEERVKVNYDHPDSLENRSSGRASQRTQGGQNHPMSGIRLQSAQPLRQSAEDRTKTGHSGRGNPASCRSAYPRSSGYQGLCGSRCR